MSGSWFSKNHGSKTVWILLPLNRKLKASCLSFLMRPESLHGKQTLRGNAHSSILFDFFFLGGGGLKIHMCSYAPESIDMIYDVNICKIYE